MSRVSTAFTAPSPLKSAAAICSGVRLSVETPRTYRIATRASTALTVPSPLASPELGIGPYFARTAVFAVTHEKSPSQPTKIKFSLSGSGGGFAASPYFAVLIAIVRPSQSTKVTKKLAFGLGVGVGTGSPVGVGSPVGMGVVGSVTTPPPPPPPIPPEPPPEPPEPPPPMLPVAEFPVTS